MSFTQKQQQFIEEYLCDFNAARAAREAGYSEKGARVIGSNLLSNVNIKDEITRRLEERKITAPVLVDRLRKLSTVDLTKYVVKREKTITNKDGDTWTEEYTTVDIEAMKADGVASWIKTIRNNSNGSQTIEFHDPVKPIELLGKHLNLFQEENKNESRTINLPGIERILNKVYGIKDDTDQDQQQIQPE